MLKVKIFSLTIEKTKPTEKAQAISDRISDSVNTFIKEKEKHNPTIQVASNDIVIIYNDQSEQTL